MTLHKHDKSFLIREVLQSKLNDTVANGCLEKDIVKQLIHEEIDGDRVYVSDIE